MVEFVIGRKVYVVCFIDSCFLLMREGECVGVDFVCYCVSVCVVIIYGDDYDVVVNIRDYDYLEDCFFFVVCGMDLDEVVVC